MLSEVTSSGGVEQATIASKQMGNQSLILSMSIHSQHWMGSHDRLSIAAGQMKLQGR
jgi:hypothetical protein